MKGKSKFRYFNLNRNNNKLLRVPRNKNINILFFLN